MPAHATLPWLYLASQSPRRRQLLDQLGVSHHLLLPDAHEDAEALEAERVGESPEDYVQRVTFAKWEAACARLVRRRAEAGHDWVEAPILCADTTVALGDQILAKPVDDADAARMLSLLSGRTHRVLTAVVVHGQLRLSTSHVTWRTLDADEIRRYVASGEPMGKAGAYAIQGISGIFVSRIQGSPSNVIGLPLALVGEMLRDAGLPLPLGGQNEETNNTETDV